MSKSYIKLGELASYINGYAFKPKDRGSEGLPIIRIQDLTGSSNDKGFYKGTYPSKIEINNGDVLISWSASLGVYVWNNGKALLNQHIFKVVFDKGEIDKDYFVYAVQFSLHRMRQLTHGATMKHVVKKDFENVLIPYPSLKDQRKVAHVLDKLKESINKKMDELTKLDELIKARFVEMFGDPISNKRGWDKQLLTNLVNKIGSGATPKGGKESYQDHGISFIRSMNVHDGDFSYTDLAHINSKQANQLSNVIVKSGDVFINITGASVARSCIVPDDILPARVNQHVSIVRCKEGVLNPIFTNNLFLNSSFKKLLLSIGSSGGATRQAITKKQLEELKIILPPISQQNEFANFVQQVDKSKFENIVYLNKTLSSKILSQLGDAIRD
ncbi:hypothetical protein CBF83_05325 [Lactobacillus taiwanensis]|uniref:restriction endonuclease subunit S n=1 Tax=Lactobacillus taiwanensis TaxID=508451 RepID=UPI000B98DA49|nr:restriction endonuclease subunit S [Lactobacillus taiwanensis]OYS41689.1 hypothetical protein CBF83_05325 [Lactobacillus taiwanensis]